MVDEFARLGLSIKYSRVAYLARKMALSSIQEFADEGVVFPHCLRYVHGWSC